MGLDMSKQASSWNEESFCRARIWHCYCHDKLGRLSLLLLDLVSGGSPVKHVDKALKMSSEESLPLLPSYCCTEQQFGALASIMDYGEKSGFWQAQGSYPKPNKIVVYAQNSPIHIGIK